MNKQTFKFSKTMLFLFIGLSSFILRSEAPNKTNPACVVINSFHSSTITSNSITYEWTGATSSWSMTLNVSVNGSSSSSGPVTGNSQTVSFTSPLVDGDVVTSELIYTDPSGLMCSLFEQVIIATSQVVLGLQESCSVYCGGVNFCEGNIPKGLPNGIERYIFKPVDLCDCNAKVGQDRFRCVQGLMKGKHSKAVLYCPSFSMFSCPYDLPYKLIVSSGPDDGPIIPPPNFRLSTKSYLMPNVYPNPFKSNVTLDLRDLPIAKGDLAIWDIYGKKVYNQSLSQDLLEINLEHLPNGIYWVTLDSNSSYMYKLVKTN